jgi:5'-3' exonuclease
MAKEFTHMAEKSDSTLMVVDALNLAFRYLHAKSTTFTDDYLRVVESLRKSYKAGKVIIAADKGSSSYRKAIYPEYKANRKDKFKDQTPEEAKQFEEFFAEYERTLLMLETIYPVLRYDGVEADDIAAYICQEAAEYHITDIWLISSDRDWDLLVSPAPSINRFSYVTRKEVTYDNWNTHYDCEPEDYVSIKCLMGDAGDNVLGVKGIGPKRAVELVQQYGSALDIAASIPISSKYKYIQELNKCKDLIMLNYQLMDLVTFCEEALGDNTKAIDSVLKEYLV